MPCGIPVYALKTSVFVQWFLHKWGRMQGHPTSCLWCLRLWLLPSWPHYFSYSLLRHATVSSCDLLLICSWYLCSHTMFSLHLLSTTSIMWSLQTHADRCGTAMCPSCVRKGRAISICTSHYLATNLLPKWTQHIFCCSFSHFYKFWSNNYCTILPKRSQSFQKDIT